MIRAVLSNSQRPDLPSVSVSFPIEAYSETYQKLEAIGIGDATIRDCFVKELGGDYPTLRHLEETEINVDELDYLAKRLESFDRYELAQFHGTAYSQNYRDMTDLINLTFCSQGVTLIQDFTDLNAVGRTHYMNLHGGLTEDERKTVDFHQTALSLMLNENGIITPYGIVYDNGIELEPIYDGLHFPDYRYSSDTLLSVAIIDTDTKDTTWLYLPAEDCLIKRALLRVGIQSDYVRLRIESDLPDLLTDLLKAEANFYEINKLCIGYQKLDEGFREKLKATFQMAPPSDILQARNIMDHLDLFDFVPGISTPEEYGRHVIRESGRFQYDDDLDEFYDFKKYGEQRMADEYGQFTSSGYISYHGFISIDELLAGSQTERMDMTMGGM